MNRISVTNQVLKSSGFEQCHTHKFCLKPSPPRLTISHLQAQRETRIFPKCRHVRYKNALQHLSRAQVWYSGTDMLYAWQNIRTVLEIWYFGTSDRGCIICHLSGKNVWRGIHLWFMGHSRHSPYERFGSSELIEACIPIYNATMDCPRNLLFCVHKFEAIKTTLTRV